MRQNILIPSMERKQPDTFCWTLIIRRSFSAWLLEKGTSWLSMNRRTSSSKSFNRSRRSLDFVLATRPGFQCFWLFFGGVHSVSASARRSRYCLRYNSEEGGSRQPPAFSTAVLISRRSVIICFAHCCPSCSQALVNSRRWWALHRACTWP